MNRNYGIGLLLLRLVLGAVFLAHGITKFQNGIENTVAFFDSLGVPGFVAYATALIEVIGGVAMILGLGTRIVAALFAVIMVGAIVTARLAAGFVGGYEFELTLLVLSVALLITGSPWVAADRLFKSSSSEE
ncbi:DoxX family protein [Paenibacillus sp. CAA11]|uniref:DoxX family protein n=1 Tax=Paenibacillus sp. CAA11 TaxID=1532905 RepID=UPI0019006A10|nr:DoxX family protein [Paenibacillus sp. CAA11]